ncbi:Hsp20/alpha crystallin family protein [Massiliimalia massiliensis]|jgi:HSP20 family protein|uniref:Hsp20/alpha crystallin family protein n=1 Tax=Massiliimalia massiliensis TaxID=1852384 RepID=UPI000985952B|nr:Hsp20/alpha crystallin family protein [Massiliimalia massiliensis]
MFELTPFERKHHRLASYNPFQELEEIERNFFQGGWSGFQTDIQDTGNAYVLETDLPGFQKEDIQIDLDDSYLTIRAERHADMEQKHDKGNYVRRERSYGAYQRSFDISGVKADEISAEYKNGVLKLIMPKKEQESRPSKRIDIK